MIKRVLFAVIVVALSAAAGYALYTLDFIVHGTLYSYGLIFSYEWANPYWSLLRIMWVLLFIIAGTTVVDMLFSIKPLLRHATERKPISKVPLTSRTVEKTPVTARTTERPATSFTLPSSPPTFATAPPPFQTTQPSVSKPISAPAPVTAATSPHEPTDLPGTFKCCHCGKNFTQPLRMLDFNSERPRIVNICPFCNEIANTPSQTEGKDQKQDGKSSYGKDNHTPRTFAR